MKHIKARTKIRIKRKLSGDQKRELRKIACGLKEHIVRGCPFDLTFFYPHSSSSTPGENDPNAPKLTKLEKEALEKYLEYHFRNIWGRTWIYMEANNIFKFIKKYK